MITCDRCLAGDAHRCRRGECANWQRTRAKHRPIRKPRASTPRQYRPKGTPRGRPPGYTREQREQAVTFLIEDGNYTRAREVAGLTKNQCQALVRVIKKLDSLKGAA